MAERDAVPARFPWRTLMAFGFGRLGLASDAFWAMTPRELAAAAEGLGGGPGAPLPRSALEVLMRRFPDGPGEAGGQP